MPVLQPLDPQHLTHACDCSRLSFTHTGELEPLVELIGQDRARRAIEFAIGMTRRGYNLFVMGPSGIGRRRLLEETLTRHATTHPAPSDWCYVADFDNPEQPLALALPAGRGRALRDDIVQFITDLLAALPAAFQSDEYRRRAQEIEDEFKQRQVGAAHELSELAATRNIALQDTPNGYSLAPLRNGRTLSAPEFQALPRDERETLQQALNELKDEMRELFGKLTLWRRETSQRLRALNSDVGQMAVDQLVCDLLARYQDVPGVGDYLHAVRQDIGDNVGLFLAGSDGEAPDTEDARFTRYRINLLVDNTGLAGAPVIYEANPTYQALVGRIDHVSHMGTLSTNFTLVRAGALHRANGGYLILDAAKVLTNPYAWDVLKRSLRSGEIRIEPLERSIGLSGAISLEPTGIALDLKVVLVGDHAIYQLLKAYDPEFGLLFKVPADFADDMRRDPREDTRYAGMIATVQQNEGLRPLSRDAVCRVIEWAAREARDGERLSLHIGNLLDLLQEADHHAGGTNSELILPEHIHRTLNEQAERTDEYRIRLHDAILRGTLMIDTEGRQLGQVNGLAVVAMGERIFGCPTRISATARIGAGEVVDIERETQLGGAIHTKGVMILSAYLASRYARHQPLSLSASLVFEQNYGQVEGDSASLAELCALLSAIGDVSIRQALAVTGSVNQHGQVQAIGGVNEKVEGFFDICRERGLNGHHGAIIPAANAKDLMLREDVRDAAAEGLFHVYTAAHVDEVMELLTEMPRGLPDRDGLYPDDSFNGRVQMRLLEWTAWRQQYSSGALTTVEIAEDEEPERH